jgi:flagellar M-ring protein FliF
MDRLYGKDKALVRVDAAIDMDKLQSVKESYDPDTELIRNSREVTEKGGTAGGHNETQTSYELNKTMETFVKTPGGIKKLSVAVLVSDAKATPEQIGKIKETVSAALGVDEERGDKLTVETMEFAPAVQSKDSAEDKTWQKENDRRELLRDVIRHGSLLLSALIFAGALFMAVKTAAPVLAAVTAAAMAPAAAAAVPAPAVSAASAAPAAVQARSREKTEASLSAQVTLSSMASEQPEVFSRAIKKFMSSPAAKNSPQKEAAGVN